MKIRIRKNDSWFHSFDYTKSQRWIIQNSVWIKLYEKTIWLQSKNDIACHFSQKVKISTSELKLSHRCASLFFFFFISDAISMSYPWSSLLFMCVCARVSWFIESQLLFSSQTHIIFAHFLLIIPYSYDVRFSFRLLFCFLSFFLISLWFFRRLFFFFCFKIYLFTEKWNVDIGDVYSTLRWIVTGNCAVVERALAFYYEMRSTRHCDVNRKISVPITRMNSTQSTQCAPWRDRKIYSLKQ